MISDRALEAMDEEQVIAYIKSGGASAPARTASLFGLEDAATSHGNVDRLLADAAKTLATWNDDARFEHPDMGAMAIYIGELSAYLRMLGAWVEQHAQACEVRTGSAL